MCPTLFTTKRTGPGCLSTMARPAGGDRLPDEMRDLAAAGVTVLVSMLSDSELAELDLAKEGDAAESAGLVFHRLPTPDRHVPDPVRVLALAGQLRSRLNEGASIVVHCREGIGRSSTLAAAILVLDGIAASAAWDLISAARGMAVPDTTAQRDFIDNLEPSS
jgi:protein-tyrosine phosphatase